MIQLRPLWVCLCAMTLASFSLSQTPAGAREKVIIDTDIGDGVDDAFAVALALKSPELEILGFTTTHGDTNLRADLLDRSLFEVGRQDIPVAAGKPTHPPVSGLFTEDAAVSFSQSLYAKGGTAPHRNHADAVELLELTGTAAKVEIESVSRFNIVLCS
ncbi:MAG: nucleoside hydrolase [Terracidiphilus sp.]